MMARSRIWQAACTVLAAALIGVAGTASPLNAQPKADAKQPEKIDLATAPKRDLIIFQSGKQVEGIVLEETDATVKFLVIVGSLRSETTYSKSEILDIKRNEFKTDDSGSSAKDKAGADKKDEGGGDKPMSSAATPDDGRIVDINNKPIPAGTLKIYTVNWKGEFGRDVSKTPVKAMVDDMARVQPDVIIIKFDFDRVHQDGQEIDYWHEGNEGTAWQDLEKAGEYDTLLGDRIRDDPAFKVKPRQVAWIRTAMGGAAFMPFVFPEIYFTSDGLHGGLGGLDYLFKGVGDEVAQRKQQSLRLARASGLAEKGGHDKRILRAMTWSSYILSYRVVGGQIEWLEDRMPESPEWFLLKDDGLSNEAHKDSMQDRVRMKGNDLLTLDAKTAFNIGLSKGTADSIDELLAKMDITRDYAIVKNKSGEIYREWHRDVNKAEADIRRLIRDFRDVQVKQPGQYEQRTAARGQQKALLRQIQSIVVRYREALDPEALKIPDADQFLNQIDIMINRIEEAQLRDKRP